ncbi:preprotein translocase subunit SecE [Candidatus Phytoplasma pini]|uniref:Preprotein translocase subunit SecE n=1 Tax=Candidatus Phytoplasma pini TaxID=267362 RepID=A0A559KJJ3_9MOLU|nr:preprotein translocase subunit SecE [Candidatus Phytoplasma pini]TVY12301.1 Preprotein translocase subunit SecE [Candidatus Phytoplasma pini]
MLHKIQDEQSMSSLFNVIKKEYSIKNIFFVIFSIFFMGLFLTLKQEFQGSDYCFLFYILFCFSFVFFMFGISPFIKKIFQDIHSVIWPSRTKIILTIIQVIFFVIIFVSIINFFNYIYNNYLNPTN